MSLASIIHSHCFRFCCTDNTQLFLSFPLDNSVSHHTFLPVSLISSTRCLPHRPYSTTPPSTWDFQLLPAGIWGLSMITKIDWPYLLHLCRFTLYNSRTIRHYLSEYSTQFHVQALIISRDWHSPTQHLSSLIPVYNPSLPLRSANKQLLVPKKNSCK